MEWVLLTPEIQCRMSEVSAVGEGERAKVTARATRLLGDEG